MLIEIGCYVELGMRNTDLGRAKLARIYIFVSPGYRNQVENKPNYPDQFLKEPK